MSLSRTFFKSSFELLFQKPPEYTHLKAFGCLCFPCLSSYRTNKLEFKSNIIIKYYKNEEMKRENFRTAILFGVFLVIIIITGCVNNDGAEKLNQSDVQQAPTSNTSNETEEANISSVVLSNNSERDKNADEHNDLGISLYNSGRYEEAEVEYRKAIEINPKHAKYTARSFFSCIINRRIFYLVFV